MFYALSAFPDSSVSEESACDAGDPGSVPGSGRSIGEGIGYPLQYSDLENSMDCLVQGVTKSRPHFAFHLCVVSAYFYTVTEYWS